MKRYIKSGSDFTKGDVLVAKDEYLASYETLEDTLGIVVDYSPDNDYLQLGTLHPEKYAFPPIFNGRGKFYRKVTDDEKKKWGIT